MTLPLWGSLQKSQDDSETIEQAIARLIVAHEEDPEAHLGDGESLSMHKHEDVIDHPAGSILGDKFSNREFVIEPIFEGMDRYQVSANQIYTSLGGFRLSTSGTTNNTASLIAGGQYSAQYFAATKNTTFQFFATKSGSGNSTAYIIAGGGGYVSEPPGVGFKFVNSALYAVEWVWDEEDFVEYTTLISGVTTSTKHVYRMQIDNTVNKAYFWIDGDLVAEMTLHASVDSDLNLFSASIRNTASSIANLSVSGIYLSIQPL